jgi:hypothetical protein
LRLRTVLQSGRRQAASGGGRGAHCSNAPWKPRRGRQIRLGGSLALPDSLTCGASP